MRRQILIINTLLFSSGFLAAQVSDSLSILDTLYFRPLNEVVISAKRFNSLGFDTPEAIRILETRSIQKAQLRTAPEALQLTPGVFVQKTNHGGGSPFIRGLTGNQTLLLIDGIRLSNSIMRYGPNQYFNTIDVFSIGRMEILRGSGSVQYGSDAIGGTIQVFSVDTDTSEKTKWGSSLLTRLATRGMEQSLRGGITFTNKYSAFRTGLTWRNFGDLVGGDTTGIQIPSGYHELDYDLKGKIIISPKSRVTMVYQNVNQRDIPIYHKVTLEDYAINRTDPQKRKLAYIRLNQDFGEGVLKSAIITASYQYSGEGREALKNNSNLLRTEFDKVNTLGFSAEGIVVAGNIWSGNVGFEIYNDAVNSNRTDTDLSTELKTLKRGLYPDGAMMRSLGLFAVNTIDLKKWNITSGVRFNKYMIKAEDEAVGIAKITPAALVGNFAVMRKVTRESNLFVSVNTGFRAPNIDDLGTLGIVDFRYETPNYDLKPESSLQYQVGYKYQDRNLRGEIFIYRNEMYNLVVRKRIEDQFIDGYPLYQKENSERAFIQGVESSWDYSLSRSLNFYGSITWTYGQNITKNEPLRRIPPVFSHLAVEYRFKELWIDLEWLATGKQDRLAQGDEDDNRIPDGGTPGWNILNVNTSYTWRFLTADFGLRNLFNKDYRYHGSGINGYGRSLYVTLAVEI